MKYFVIIGTRPEAIKMAPVILELRQRNHPVIVCSTGQHKEMLNQVLNTFSLQADFELDVMVPNQSLVGLSAELLFRLDSVLRAEKPDWILVQGDTTSVLIASLCSYYNRIRIGHVEAGLRSFDKYSPFPEEINRQCVSRMADMHFAPTQAAVENLLNEGIISSSVILTGNTVVDALRLFREELTQEDIPEKIRTCLSKGSRIVLITCHRRESFGKPLLNIFAAVKRLALAFPDTTFCYPVHLNPQVRERALTAFKNTANILLLEPLEYREFLATMSNSYLIMSDSGGVQEEAPSFGIPLLILREVTERPEGIIAGVAKLVGSDENKIFSVTSELLSSTTICKRMRCAENPYGDGMASKRICNALENGNINDDHINRPAGI